MEFVQNFPFICIILSLFSGPLSSILNGKKAKWWNTFVITVIGVMNVCVLAFVVRTGEPYVYRMGHFSAPWGNEIRVGILEAVMAVFFCVTMLLWVYFFRWFEHVRFGSPIRRALKYIGENSMTFMCFSHIGLYIGLFAANRLPVGAGTLHDVAYLVIGTLAVVPIVVLFNRTKLHYLFGK